MAVSSVTWLEKQNGPGAMQPGPCSDALEG
jgi:hypothetical protein